MTTQKIPLMGAKGGLNNRTIIMWRVVTKEKKELWGIKEWMKVMSWNNCLLGTCNFKNIISGKQCQRHW